MVFGGVGDAHRPFRVDPVPRLIDAAEWAAASAGLAQRARALTAFLADAYGERADRGRGRGAGAGDRVGRLPRAADADGLEVRAGRVRRRAGPGARRRRRAAGAGGQHAHPVGLAYAIGARAGGGRRAGRPGARRAPGRPRTCSRCSPPRSGAARPTAADRPARGAALRRAGQQRLARAPRAGATHMGLPLVTPADLSVRGGRLHAALGGGRARAPSTWSTAAPTRTGCATSTGRPTWLPELLLPARPRGHADRGQPPGLGRGRRQARARLRGGDGRASTWTRSRCCARCPPTTWATPSSCPRPWSGSASWWSSPATATAASGVVLCRHCSAEELRARPSAWCASDPDSFVAQELVTLSTHPTVIDGRLAPRHVDLRPFVVGGGHDVDVAPGGPDPGRLRAGRDGGQQFSRRRRQGHVGDGMRPLIAVTTSEMRGVDGPQADPARRAARARSWRSA